MRQLLRFFGRVRRTFGRSPHWLRDVYGLLSYVNFLELIPTLAAIGLAPRHFFRRLPQILTGSHTHYTTPVKFFANFAALFVMFFFLRHGDLSGVIGQSNALWLMPLLIPVTPFAMFGLSMACWLLYQLPRLAPNGDAFPPPNPGPFKLLLNPFSYLKLQPNKYFWGLFYISVYFVSAWQFVQVLVALGVLSAAYLFNQLGEGHLVVKGIILLLGVGLAAMSIHGLVLHPYTEMFRAALRRPTRAVFESDVFEIRQAIGTFLKNNSDASPLEAQASELVVFLEGETKRLITSMVRQNADFGMNADEVGQRARIHDEAIQFAELNRRIEPMSAELRAQFERILRPFVLERGTAISIAA